MFNKIGMTIWLCGVALHFGVAAPASMAEKPAMPEDLYFEFKPVPAEENAIINWRRAAAIKVVLNDKQKAVIKFCWTPAAREPAAGELNDLQAWLKRNQEALDLFDASLSKPKAQWPERDPQNTQPEMLALPHFVRARLFVADQLAAANKFEAAAKSLEETLKLTQMGVEGDAALTHYLIACNSRTMTQDAILRLAARKNVPLPTLERLLKDLPGIDSETNIYSKILRVEFTRGYYHALDMKRLAENWSKVAATNAAFLGLFPDELQPAARVLLDPSLVPIHPKPYDVYGDIEEDARHFRIYRTNSLGFWTDRDGTVELDHELVRTNLARDVAPLMELVKSEPLPLSRAAVQRARLAYLGIENPVGRLFETSVLGFVSSDLKVCQVRTERAATRGCLAAIIFERRKGQLPAALSDLVAEKILPVEPVDYFCGESLHYSKEKRKIWSVSDNGVDDHGESGAGRWYEKDAVWQIPELR